MNKVQLKKKGVDDVGEVSIDSSKKKCGEWKFE